MMRDFAFFFWTNQQSRRIPTFSFLEFLVSEADNFLDVCVVPELSRFLAFASDTVKVQNSVNELAVLQV